MLQGKSTTFQLHSTFVRQAAAKVICHELSHQYFGDLVTAWWWSDLFLNEGFAAFFEIASLKLALPEQTTFLVSLSTVLDNHYGYYEAKGEEKRDVDVMEGKT